jgi:lysophospholipase L1-like esterase
VVAVSIPDWSVAPAAADYGEPARLRSLTESFNAIARAEALGRRFTWVDITDVSRRATESSGWIASDRLHPSDPQYAAWADTIWSAVREVWSGN